MHEKTCWRCSTAKPLDAFWNDKRQRDGKQAACIVCQRERMVEWKAANPDYFQRKGRAKYRKEDNPARYARYMEEFKAAHARARGTPRGRMVDLLSAARTRSKKMGRAFTLTLEELLELWESQAGRCALTGLEMEFTLNPPGKRSFLPFTPSLDRKDSHRGYTKDNVRLVCCVVNLALNRFGDEVFDRMCKAYAAKHA